MGLFNRVEQRIERAVTGVFARAFKSEVQPVEIASAIRRAMDERAAVLGRGRTIVPNLFTVELAESDYEHLTAYADDLTDELVAAAQEHADTQRYTPGGPVRVLFHANTELETGVFQLRPSTAKAAATAGASPAAPARQPPPAVADQDPTARQYADPPAAVPPPRRQPVHRPWLDIDGQRYPLLGAITVLGRDDSADVVLDDPGISRHHSEIRVTSDGPHLLTSVRDLHSTNGTYVNGDPVTSRRLADGDRITLGRTALIFRTSERR